MAIDKIICVGKNYLDHAKELGDAIPAKPVLFLKPPSVLKGAQKWGDTVRATLPQNRGEVHYECEIILRVAKGGQTFDAVSIGLDMTLRTVQAELKKQGHPWEIAKVFQDAAIIGPWVPLKDFADFMATPFSLEVDGELRQQGKLSEAIMSPQALIPYIQSFFPLREGDIIFTGTPAGVGPITVGSRAILAWKGFQYNVIWN